MKKIIMFCAAFCLLSLFSLSLHAMAADEIVIGHTIVLANHKVFCRLYC